MSVDVLTMTSLYPNAVQPRHGVFVEQRLRHLLATGEVRARVMAGVPWFPSRHPAFGRYGAFARVPRHERRHGIEIDHPRYPVIPKIGQNLAPLLMYAALAPAVRRLRARHRFQLIDAHFFYPDGVAAAAIGRRLGVPVVITARGNDVSLMPRYALPRRMIVRAARRAAGIVTVCQALKDGLVDLGVEAGKIVVLRNGVDLDQFRPVDRDAARAALGLEGRLLVSVGHLIERKGNHVTIAALPMLPGYRLLLVGDGEEEGRLREQARRLGVADRVHFLGHVDQPDLPRIYAAADALVLASSREGWANVLLESMACGTPVVATNVWGTPEVVAAPEAGVLMRAREPGALADAVRSLFAAYPDRSRTRRYAEGFSWDDTSRGQADLFRRLTNGVAAGAGR